MKKLYLFLLSLLSVFMLASCGEDSKQEVTITDSEGNEVAVTIQESNETSDVSNALAFIVQNTTEESYTGSNVSASLAAGINLKVNDNGYSYDYDMSYSMSLAYNEEVGMYFSLAAKNSAKGSYQEETMTQSEDLIVNAYYYLDDAEYLYGHTKVTQVYNGETATEEDKVKSPVEDVLGELGSMFPSDDILGSADSTTLPDINQYLDKIPTTPEEIKVYLDMFKQMMPHSSLSVSAVSDGAFSIKASLSVYDIIVASGGVVTDLTLIPTLTLATIDLDIKFSVSSAKLLGVSVSSDDKASLAALFLMVQSADLSADTINEMLSAITSISGSLSLEINYDGNVSIPTINKDEYVLAYQGNDSVITY